MRTEENHCTIEIMYACVLSFPALALSILRPPDTLPDLRDGPYGDTFAVAVTSVFVAAAQAFGIFRLHPRCRIHGPVFVSGNKASLVGKLCTCE